MAPPAINGSEVRVTPLEPTLGEGQGPIGEEVQAPPPDVDTAEFQRKYGTTSRPPLRVLAGGPPTDSPPSACDGPPEVVVPEPKYNETTMSAAGTQAKVTFCGSAQKAQDILTGKDAVALKGISDKTISAKLEGDTLTIKTWADKGKGLIITLAVKVTVTDGDYKGTPCKVVTLQGTDLPESDKTIHLSPYKVEYKIATVDGKTVVSMTIKDHGTVIKHLSEDAQKDIKNIQGAVREGLKADLYNFFKNLAAAAK